jgi:hypothetical protein
MALNWFDSGCFRYFLFRFWRCDSNWAGLLGYISRTGKDERDSDEVRIGALDAVKLTDWMSFSDEVRIDDLAGLFEQLVFLTVHKH